MGIYGVRVECRTCGNGPMRCRCKLIGLGDLEILDHSLIINRVRDCQIPEFGIGDRIFAFFVRDATDVQQRLLDDKKFFPTFSSWCLKLYEVGHYRVVEDHICFRRQDVIDSIEVAA